MLRVPASATSNPSASLAREGENCWRIVRADRVAALIDGSAYFPRVRQALMNARRTIHIVGWDLDTRVVLRRDGVDDGAPVRLGPLLHHLVARNRELRVYVQVWHAPAVFSLERERWRGLKLRWRGRGRIRFRHDKRLPVTASHHEKIVVVDDEVAFVGGQDLTAGRYDTPRHLPDDPRREDEARGRYAPFHEMQIAVSGPAAKALGEHARERWRADSGREPRRPEPGGGDVWPAGLAPDFEDVEVGLARTAAAFGGRPEVREVERLFLDSIASARRCIYAENQYFTSPAIAGALGARLREPDGPEVVLVLRRACSGWLEDRSMRVLRVERLRQVASDDLHGRLRVLRPVHGDREIRVHAKVTVIDDRMLRVGSANLTDRSFGMDTECDLAVLASEDRHRDGVLAVRHRLVAEHLDVRPEEVARAVEDAGSLGAAIDALRERAGAKTLVDSLDDAEEEVDKLPSVDALADPARPLAPTRLIERLLPQIRAERRSARRMLPMATVLAASLLGVGVLAFGGDGGHVDHARRFVLAFEVPHAPVVVPAAVVIGSFLLVPQSLVIVLATLLVGAARGGLLAAAGCLAAAVLGHLLGRAVGRRAVLRLTGLGSKVALRRLEEGGIGTVALARLLPVAPSVVVSLLAGAAHVPPARFLVGTALGLVPSLVAFALVGALARRLLLEPGPVSAGLLVAAALVPALGVGWAMRHVERHVPPWERA
ncbi:MAG: VTT domain-containing protein [Planctomycetota bacterium JB042]